MPNKILYIHGFASTGLGVKSTQLKNILNTDVIAPNLNHQPMQDLVFLKQLIEAQKIQTVVGSSLGGFYALLLALKYPIKTILINPSLNGVDTLQKYIGVVQRYNGGSFIWAQQDIDELRMLSQQILPEQIAQLDQAKILMLLATHDEVLDYQVAKKLLKDSKIILDDVQDHRFADLKPYAKILTAWHDGQ